jgi:uncharacterized membrane protein YfcA
MEEDYRDQFNLLRPKIRRQWILIIFTFIGIIPCIAVVAYLFGEEINPIFFIIYALLYGYLIFGLLKFKCPNCSKSLYVTTYIGKLPLIVQSWVSRYCNHCGVRLK